MVDIKTEIFHLLALGTAFIVLFALGEFLYHIAKWKGDQTRKLIHAITGLITLLFPIYLSSWISVGLLCAGFLVILFASKKMGLIKSINDVDRRSSGSVLYPIVIFVVFVIYQMLVVKYHHGSSINYFYLPVLILAICDPLAAAIGKRFGKHKVKYYDHKKSWEGTIAFTLAAFVISFFLIVNSSISLMAAFGIALFIALVTSTAELLSRDGWDNVSIPLTTIVIYFLAQQFVL
jgi:phytol kinase